MLKKLFYSIMRLYTTNSVWAYSAIMAKAIIIDYCVRIFEPKPHFYYSIAFIAYEQNVDRIRHVAHRASSKQNRQGKTRYDIK